MDFKNDPTITCVQENHFRSADTYRLKVKIWKDISCKQQPIESSGSYAKIRKKYTCTKKTVKGDK